HRIPMVLKRGYHRHFTGGGPDLPAMDAENGTFLSPMRQGLRVLTGAELTTMEAVANPRQITRSTQVAKELFGDLKPVEDQPWVGTRPCMPDMLPIMGPSDRQKGLWLNFGHAHHGFTLGPTAGRLLAEQIG
ncbi:NAD(P)/FAD-dependent oxidoreductase, partial [Devosia sp.]|uniref:NAD(P)/FAD-dependent oxidoreductase n=1 Tax=Devosia sp. TaxID=1871048 RepID=UPI003A9502D5